MCQEPSDLPPQIRQAVNSFAPFKGFEWTWHPYPIEGNYDPGKALSATLHTVEMATASSPTQIALYRNGEFVGQGTPVAGAFVSLVKDDCTDDTVAIRLKIPGQSHAGPPKSLHYVAFKLVEGQVYWTGDWPFDDYAPGVPGWPELLEEGES